MLPGAPNPAAETEKGSVQGGTPSPILGQNPSSSHPLDSDPETKPRIPTAPAGSRSYCHFESPASTLSSAPQVGKPPKGHAARCGVSRVGFTEIRAAPGFRVPSLAATPAPRTPRSGCATWRAVHVPSTAPLGDLQAGVRSATPGKEVGSGGGAAAWPEGSSGRGHRSLRGGGQAGARPARLPGLPVSACKISSLSPRSGQRPAGFDPHFALEAPGPLVWDPRGGPAYVSPGSRSLRCIHGPRGGAGRACLRPLRGSDFITVAFFRSLNLRVGSFLLLMVKLGFFFFPT